MKTKGQRKAEERRILRHREKESNILRTKMLGAGGDTESSSLNWRKKTRTDAE